MPFLLSKTDIRKFRRLIKQHNPLLVVLIAVLFLGLGVWLGQETDFLQQQDTTETTQVNATGERSGPHEVVSVIDGDTVRVRMNGVTETVRLIGIDTPEVDGPYTELECYGAEASARTRELLEGKFIMLEADETRDNRDQYDRLLRYVILEDDTNLNLLLVEEGYAYEYTFRTAYRYQGEFIQAQQDARDNQRGLWSDDACGGLTTPLSDDITSGQAAPIEPETGCISVSKAPDNVGANTCVTGRVDHVHVSGTNTTFINYCEDFRNCPFSAVVFDSNRHNFQNLEDLAGQVITINGTIEAYEGRPQIILREAAQLQR